MHPHDHTTPADTEAVPTGDPIRQQLHTMLVARLDRIRRDTQRRIDDPDEVDQLDVIAARRVILQQAADIALLLHLAGLDGDGAHEPS